MKLKSKNKSCIKCKHYIKSTKECSNIRAEEQMIKGITDYKKGCNEYEYGNNIGIIP